MSSAPIRARVQGAKPKAEEEGRALRHVSALEWGPAENVHVYEYAPLFSRVGRAIQRTSSTGSYGTGPGTLPLLGPRVLGALLLLTL